MQEKYLHAEKNLSDALIYETSINGWDIEDCQYWRDFVIKNVIINLFIKNKSIHDQSITKKLEKDDS